ncbi:protein lin-28-like protein [Dinothrombium tinctorium]|nr:protein lin-28-like protein [Dinothrombium tinctorium]RWS07060.1 protein lin-28-like protein [Dinothrombium tinctorium]
MRGFGFIAPNDGGPDVLVHYSVINMYGYQTLSVGMDVEFEWEKTEKGLRATLVTWPTGFLQRPMLRKLARVKCYNCGKKYHFAANCNMDSKHKKCYNCFAVDHLKADCPLVKESRFKYLVKKNDERNSDSREVHMPQAGPSWYRNDDHRDITRGRNKKRRQ